MYLDYSVLILGRPLNVGIEFSIFSSEKFMMSEGEEFVLSLCKKPIGMKEVSFQQHVLW